jgi:hypothetical protein
MLSCLTPVSSVNIVLLFVHLYISFLFCPSPSPFLFSNDSSRSGSRSQSRFHSRPVPCPGSLIEAIFHHSSQVASGATESTCHCIMQHQKQSQTNYSLQWINHQGLHPLQSHIMQKVIRSQTVHPV